MGPLGRDLLSIGALIGVAGVGGAMIAGGSSRKDGYALEGVGWGAVVAGVGVLGAGMFADDLFQAAARSNMASVGAGLLAVGGATAAFLGVRALMD